MPEVDLPLNAPPPIVTGESMATILIIDDESAIRDSLEVLLTLEGYRVKMAADGDEGLRELELDNFDLILLDLAMPGRSGLELLPLIKERQPDIPVIMITAYGTVENVVEAIRAGADNFVQKPWDNEKLLADIRSAVVRHRVEEENQQLKRTLKQRYNFTNIVGKSEIIMRVLDLVGQVAPSRSTVLIQGESGTGKELIAKAIHANSPRRDKAFVPINTGAMPSELLESTLFGHVKGAFTSAIAAKKGLFEVANGGTLFLDEIATMGMDTQAKILRVLQDRRFMHLGGIQEIQVDVRIIAATNIDLDYEWPGNVRELENCIERGVVLSSGPMIGSDLLPGHITGRSFQDALLEHNPNASLFDILEDIERRIIIEKLERCNWNQTDAAEQFHIPLSTLNQKIKRLNIEIRKRGRE
jgi:DNA-binding NtrC family response regulator